MHYPYLRPLTDRSKIEGFLRHVLRSEQYADDYDLVGKIKTCELELADYENSEATINSQENRHAAYRSDHNRWALRKKIVEELFSLPVPKEESDLNLGNGGALPNSDLKKERKIFILIGLPASGKSGIAMKTANAYGAITLDSDFAKRKIPEFEPNHGGASLVHSESSAIVWGHQDWPETFTPLLKLCTDAGINIVAPRIGNDVADIVDMATIFNALKYEVHLTLVSLDRAVATKRALDRFTETKRYVPLSLVFDVYANDPILTYYRLKEKRNNLLFSTFGKISTDVKKGDPYIVIHSEKNNPAELFTEQHENQHQL